MGNGVLWQSAPLTLKFHIPIPRSQNLLQCLDIEEKTRTPFKYRKTRDGKGQGRNGLKTSDGAQRVNMESTRQKWFYTYHADKSV